MTIITESIDVAVPVRTAYDQWTQFEEFPRFMGGIDDVRQLDETHLRWVASIGGVRREWEAEIVEQLPDERIAWRSGDGRNAGRVDFEPIDPENTRIDVSMCWDPDGLTESLGSAVGLD